MKSILPGLLLIPLLLMSSISQAYTPADSARTDSLPYLKTRASLYSTYVSEDQKLMADSSLPNLKASFYALQEVVETDDLIMKEYQAMYSTAIISDSLLNKLVRENQELAADYNEQKDRFLWLLIIAAALNVFLIVFIILFILRNRKINRIRKEIRKTREETEKTLREVDAAGQEIAKLKAIEAEMLKEKIELTQTVEQALQHAKTDTSQADAVRKESEARISLLKTEINNLFSEKSKLQNELDEIKKNSGASAESRDKAEKELAFLKTSLDIEKQAKKRLEEENTKMKSQLSQPGTESTDKDKKISELEYALKNSEIRTTILSNQVRQLSDQNEALKKKQTESSGTDAGAPALETKLREYEQQIADLNNRLKAETDRNEELKKSPVTELHPDKDARIAELESRLADTEAARSLIEQELKNFFEEIKKRK